MDNHYAETVLVERIQVRQLEPIAVRGRKNIDATRKGHIGKHGTEEQKATRWNKYQTEFNLLAEANPHWSVRSC